MSDRWTLSVALPANRRREMSKAPLGSMLREPMTTRALTVLHNMNIESTDDESLDRLALMRACDLIQRRRRCGVKTLAELRDLLHRYGRAFADEAP